MALNNKTPDKANSNVFKPKKVAIYIRVSTTHQIDKDSLPMQRKDLVAYASLLLGIEEYEIFEDAGYSGKNTIRPAFQNMMKRIRAGEFSHLLVWKIDRISRNLIDFAEMYKELQKLRVTFVSKNEQFDTSSAMGEAMLKIILVFAELERNMTSERVTATMISRANNGIWNGGRIPYGYSYNPDTSEFSIDEEEEKVCTLMKEDYLKYNSLVHTTRLLNDSGYKTRAGVHWTPTAVRLILSSPFYAGIYRYNRYKGNEQRVQNPEEEWILIANHHPAIFTIDEHEHLLAILSHNNRTRNTLGQRKQTQRTHLFSGIAYCGKCGCKMVSTPGKLLTNGYRPSNYSCPKRRNTNDCNNTTVNDMIVGEFVINYILNMLNAKKNFSNINTPKDLEKALLLGNTFSKISGIENNGLNEYYNLLTRYSSDDSFTINLTKPKRKTAFVDPKIDSLRKEKEKLERALTRLQNLYLYSNNAFSEKDFMLKKTEICDSLDKVNSMLGMINLNSNRFLTDEEFVRQASHLLISKRLSNNTYIYFRNLVQDVSPEILKLYFDTILDSIQLVDGCVTSIMFNNGLIHKFIYND